MNPIVKKYLQKKLFDQKGFIASAKAVQFSYNALETRMKNLGLDINLIKSERDLNQALGFVKTIEDQAFAKKFGDTLKKQESAEIFDLDKNKLNPKEPIIGGTQDEKDMLQKSIKKNVDEATKKGNFKGIANQLLRDPDILREFQMMKKFPFRRDLNVRSGEDAIPLARAAKFDEETKDLNISLTPGKDAEGTVGEFVQQMKKFGVDDKDIQMMLGSGKSGQVDYVMEQYGLSASDVVDLLKSGKPLIEGLATGGRAGFSDGTPSIKLFPRASGRETEQEVGPGIKISERDLNYGITGLLEGDKFFGGAELDKGKVKIDVRSPEGDILFKDTIGKKDAVNFILGIGDPKGEKFQIKTDKDFNNMQLILKKSFAKGGRAGFKVGSSSKRTFLKVMGGLAATIAAIKSGLIGAPKKEVAKQVVKETATDVAKAPPKYFFDLANKIKLLGKQSKVKPKERTDEYSYTGKDGSEYTLTEDMGTGEMQIVKEKGGIGVADDKAYDTIDDRTVMEYRPGKSMADEGTKGTPADEYDEFRVDFDVDGTPADADEISEIVKKQIIEEASDIPEKKIKRAGGGVAYMLGE